MGRLQNFDRDFDFSVKRSQNEHNRVFRFYLFIYIYILNVLQKEQNSWISAHYFRLEHFLFDHFVYFFKGIVQNFGHRAFPSQPWCSLSLVTVFDTFHSVLLVAEFARARLAHGNGQYQPDNKAVLPTPHSTPGINQL